MAELNKVICAEDFRNTGIGDCPLVPKHIVGMFIVPRDFKITSADSVNLKEFLEDAAKNDDTSKRILPVHGFVGFEDNTEDLVAETLGYGGIAPIREGKYDLTFRLGRGGTCLSSSLRSLNGRSVRVLLIDADGVIFGTMEGGDLKGIPLEMFYALPFTFSDGSGTTTSFRFRIVLDPKYLNDYLGFIDTSNDGFTPSEIEGLLDIVFKKSGAGASVSVTAFAGCGSQNVLKDFSTELSDPDLWVATNPSTGAAITITSVSINDAGVATLTGVNAPARISLVKVSELEARGIVGYESRAIVIS